MLVIVELALDVPEGVEPPSSEEISDELNSLLLLGDSWRFLGFDASLHDVRDVNGPAA